MELLSVLPEAETRQAGQDPEIGHVRHDSRQVLPGDLFVAIRGSKTDGYDHVREALARGAAAIVSSHPAPDSVVSLASVSWVRVAQPRRALALLAARRAGNPAEKLVLSAVTGTNGKTTTTMLLEALLARHYGRSGFLGTVAYRTGKREIIAPRTTPESPVVQDLLAEMVAEGVPAAALEVSSHALALDRVEGCRFDVAVFTNLTRDHLDFHHDMESYYAAKKRLFSMRKRGASAVVNADDPYGARLAREVEPPVWTYSAAGHSAGARADKVRCDLNGISFEVAHAAGRFRLESGLLGQFNVENLLAAAGAGLALGISPDEMQEAFVRVKRVPGRFEPVEAGQPYTILVDYAHTEDALSRLLLAVRGLTEKRIVLVFGCGGDRDKGKRFPMGEIAGRLADIPIATSDNPRSEDPETILSEIERGLVASGRREYWKIVDRREAIAKAIGLADPGTVIVIAGKGHETTQVIGERELPFDDRTVAAELARRQ
jgi:UDP-N-acetylmuramoyl-L-alanyl-D-glutamate--2,6-diaminopimelate ligase